MQLKLNSKGCPEITEQPFALYVLERYSLSKAIFSFISPHDDLEEDSSTNAPSTSVKISLIAISAPSCIGIFDSMVSTFLSSENFATDFFCYAMFINQVIGLQLGFNTVRLRIIADTYHQLHFTITDLS